MWWSLNTQADYRRDAAANSRPNKGQEERLMDD
jgi:hypothetical protein